MNADPILITGVGRRVGLHLARTFLSRKIRVIGTYRTKRDSVDALIKEGADLYRCDFLDDTQIELFSKRIKSKYDRLRGIIHNASDWLPDNHELPPGDIIRRMMQVHVNAPYLLNMSLASLLYNSSEDYADIVHISDYVGSIGSKKHIAYAASKAGLDNLTLSFARKFGPKVKVNSVAPALVLFNEQDDDAYRQKTLEKNLMRKEGGLEEFQHAVDYLINSRFVTGRVLQMDGGRHLV